MPRRQRIATMARFFLPIVCLVALAALLAGCQPTDRSLTKDPKAIAAPLPPAADRSIEELARTDHVALLEKCLQHYDETYRDYTCTFYKQERMNDVWKPEQAMKVKFRDKPFSVAMAWIKNPTLADRVLYVQGKWKNQMLGRPASPVLRSLKPVALRNPTGETAMKETRRPITQFGFRNALVNLLKEYRRAIPAGHIMIAGGKRFAVDGRPTVRLVRLLAVGHDYPAKRTEIYIDTDYLVPVAIYAWDWDDKPIARYLYKNVRFNVGLTDRDFTPAANDMAEPK